MEDMRRKEDHLEKEMMEVSVQNKRLADPLQKARDDMSEMHRKVGNYERDKQILLVSLLRSPLPRAFSWAPSAAAACLLRPRAGFGLLGRNGTPNLSFL